MKKRKFTKAQLKKMTAKTLFSLHKHANYNWMVAYALKNDYEPAAQGNLEKVEDEIMRRILVCAKDIRALRRLESHCVEPKKTAAKKKR